MKAPWTDEQVKSLNEYQHSAPFHPFTCGKRDGHQSDGVLIATNDGWTCPEPGCDYTQDWCHDDMANGQWRDIAMNTLNIFK